MMISRNSMIVFLAALFNLMFLCVEATRNQTLSTTFDTNKSNNNNNNNKDKSNTNRPIIYTFFHRIDIQDRVTGMKDEDDDRLIQFWKEEWSKFGWQPQVLTLEDIITYEKEFPQYLSTVRNKLKILQLDSFGKVLFYRWMAMSTIDGGGWYSDYDVFPIRNINIDNNSLPNNGRMTLYDIVSPTLASGNATEWMLTLNALLDEAILAKANEMSDEEKLNPTSSRRLMFWTDRLSIMSLIRKYGAGKSPCPYTGKQTLLPYGRKDPVLTSYDCNSKPSRGRLVVHFDPETIQSAQFVPPHSRLPKYRLKLASEWLPKWHLKCQLNKTIESR